MKIGIIGAGHIGGTLTRRLAAAGHEVSVANSRGPESLASLAAESGARAATVGEVVKGKDVVIVTIPLKASAELPKGLFGAADARTVVVDTGNYYPQRDGHIGAIENGAASSRWVADQLGRPVVKAFNTIHAKHLAERGRPKGDPARMAVSIAGDDDAAKAVVLELIEDLGFDGVDAGSLDESWRQEPGTPVYGAALGADATRRAIAEARRAQHA
jgi:8-hydroxy-5-deazaflavin:NADPH oxidoreductase